MKKLIMVLLAAAIVLCGSAAAFAADAPGLVIGNEPVPFTESTGFPFVDEANRTLVPLRVAMEAFGCEVEWDAANQCAVVSQNAVTVTVPLQQKYIFINGMKAEIDTQAVAKNGRIYLPLRAVLEAFGGEVSWDAATNCITVTKQDEAPQRVALSVEDRRQLIGNAMFSIYTYNHYTFFQVKTGNGFFISADGLAVVNAETIKDSTSAQVYYGKEQAYFDVESVLYMSEELDIAVIRVSQFPSGREDVSVQFDYLTLADRNDFELDEELYSWSMAGSFLSHGDLQQNGIHIDLIVAQNLYNSNVSAGWPFVDIYGHVVAVSSSKLPSDFASIVSLPAVYIMEALKHLDEQPYGTVNTPAGRVETGAEKTLYRIDVGETLYVPVTVNTSGGAQPQFISATSGSMIKAEKAIWLEKEKCLIPVAGSNEGLGLLWLYNANSDEVDVIMLCIGDTELKINYYPDHRCVPDFGNSLFADGIKALEANNVKGYSLIDGGFSAMPPEAWYVYYCALLEYAGCEHIETGCLHMGDMQDYVYDVFLSADKTEEICVLLAPNAVLGIRFDSVTD